MKTYYIDRICGALLLLAAASCSQEEPWDGKESKEGFLNRDAMAVEFRNSEYLVRSNGVDLGNFQVEIRQKAATGEGQLVKSYAYREMPEIVALPVGEYTVHAVYGNNDNAEWDAPYYKGNSEFTIEADKVTDDLEPVVAKLSNVRVTINFGSELAAAMSDDSKVTVKVGQTGSLDFTKQTVGRSGYFAHTPGSQTITATFSGTIDGQEVVETKAYDNASPGNHYKVNFDFHQASGDLPGDVSGSVVVDASVITEDMTQNINPDDEYLEDDMRPVEDEEDPGTDPGPGPGPTPADPVGPAPLITASEGIDLNALNTYTAGMECELVITSQAEGGITAFTVDIISPTLDAAELEGVGLAAHLDMVNPDEEIVEGLQDLGFPVYVGGSKEVTFKITDFLPMLAALGEADHQFVLKVTDANGSVTATLRIHTN